MNLWKPTALVMTAAFTTLLGYNVAHATPAETKPVPVAGEYYNMRVAMEHLRAARWALGSAEHDRNGWKVRAIEATDRAIYETRMAMDW